METLNLQIEGMTCNGCVKSINQALSTLEGIIRADVSLEEKKAHVAFDETKIQADRIIEAVEDAGFDAAPMPV